MNINPLAPLNDDEAGRLAGCLLTSSTIERYLDCLHTSQAVQRLTDLLNSSPSEGTVLVRHAWLLWAELLAVRERSESEVSLSALLYVLAHSGSAEAGTLLLACSLSERLQASWISALARKLLANRTESTILRNAVQISLEDILVTASFSDARDTVSVNFPNILSEGNPASLTLKDLGTLRKAA
jgi:hypothetical protein